MRWLGGIIDSMDMSLSKLQETVKAREAWCATVHGVLKARILKWFVIPFSSGPHFVGTFELWCWRKLLRVPQTARSNQPILKEINPEYSLEGLMLKLKLQYFGHLIQRTDSMEKTRVLGKIEGGKRRE